MKKLLYGAATALLLLSASCGKSGNNESDKFFSDEATDSLLMTFGAAAGTFYNNQISDAMFRDSTVSKELFLKGLQYALAADSAESFSNGMIAGLQLQRQVAIFNRMGIQADSRVVLESFKKAFMSDSVPSQAEMSMMREQLRIWSDSLERAKRSYEIAKLEAQPEAIENTAKGEAFIQNVMSKDPEVKLSTSGLAYKIENPGEGEKINPNQRVVLTYTAKTADGKVVDKSEASPVIVAMRTPALQEGVSMLAKGGRATFYAPGKLAYGVEAPTYLEIGPNELIIYEVEVVDLPAANPVVAQPTSQPTVRLR